MWRRIRSEQGQLLHIDCACCTCRRSDSLICVPPTSNIRYVLQCKPCFIQRCSAVSLSYLLGYRQPQPRLPLILAQTTATAIPASVSTHTILVAEVSLTLMQCAALAVVCKGEVSYFNDTIYVQEQKYWSWQQAHTYPTCRFSPVTAAEVSIAILEVRKTQCPFAVKGGGHAAFRGGSNIQGGITIDMTNLDTIEVAADKTTTFVGSGNRWEYVYAKLDSMNLAVIGGRTYALQQP